ncbi:IclR family transcriptional regulator [Methylobacterium sp. E-066]|uniref:IclR family transcriptional regulator n=1 Tax=Methylobacterium sp. E-066 TaxID=2836584 RepID=UPI001FBBA11F|nr:IclR family transcriptional regulator [Methylobacterium sp. E-066]MCJ2144776.1 IclR family transcriptional regulator [Methylobacterium sp. E-066]
MNRVRRSTTPSRPAPEREAGPEGDRQFVTALARGLTILGCFSPARPEIGGSELAALTGLPQPTVWRLCHTMIRQGFLVPVNGDKLRPGIPILQLGRAVLAGIPLAERAQARMQALANRFGSATGLGARDENRMVFVQRCLSDAQLLMNLRIGSRLPLATSAVGWGLLSGYEEAERAELIERHAAPDPRWQKAEPEFRRTLQDYATQGFITNLGAFHQGYNTAAAPVFGPDGRPAFALSCGGSAVTHTPAFLRREVGPEVVRLAVTLEAELGGRRPKTEPR